MKTVKLITSILFMIIISACTTDDHNMDSVQSTSGTQDTEVKENPQTTQTEEPSEEPTSPPATEEGATASQSTAVARHYYELNFSDGPMNGTTLADSVAIGNGLAQYSDVKESEVITILIQDGDVLINGLLTRYKGADTFPFIEEFKTPEETAAHLFFSFVPPGPSPAIHNSESGTLELSDLEIYKFQNLGLATLKITFEGSFVYKAPPEEDETVKSRAPLRSENIRFRCRI